MSDLTREDLRELQEMPLDDKIAFTVYRIHEFFAGLRSGTPCVSFSGGKDSTVLLDYIKGMEMPTSWRDCVFSNGMAQCKLANMEICDKVHTHRSICPLVPVPPHGRLGDLDALHKLFLEKGKKYKGFGGAMVAAAAWCIANAPTIIPASEEGET